MEMPKVWAVLLKYSVSCVFFGVLPTETYNLVGFTALSGKKVKISKIQIDQSLGTTKMAAPKPFFVSGTAKSHSPSIENRRVWLIMNMGFFILALRFLEIWKKI